MIKDNALKSEAFIKVCLLINSVLWAIYGYYVELYPILIFNIINIVFCIISIVRIIILSNKAKNYEKAE